MGARSLYFPPPSRNNNQIETTFSPFKIFLKEKGTLENTLDIDLFSDEFMKDPEYLRIQDFNHKFKIYTLPNLKLKIIELENKSCIRHLIWQHCFTVAFDFYFNIDNSKLLTFDYNFRNCSTSQKIDYIKNILTSYFLQNNKVIKHIEQASLNANNFWACTIHLEDIWHSFHGFYFYEEGYMILLNTEELISITFIDLFSKIFPTNTISYKI